MTIPVGDGVVRDVLPALAEGGDDPWLHSGFLTAGLVDVQVNGAFGVDFARATPDDWLAVSRQLPASGVTAYVPTFITARVTELGVSLDRTSEAQVAQVAQAPGVPQARILGAHLEGPFISGLRSGAHDTALTVDPGPAELAELLSTSDRRAVLRIVTLAPERQGALEAIRRLAGAGVLVSLGHTSSPTCSTPCGGSTTGCRAWPAGSWRTRGSASA